MSYDNVAECGYQENLDATIEAIERLKSRLNQIEDAFENDLDVVLLAQENYRRDRENILSAMGWTPDGYVRAVDLQITRFYRRAS